jgi:arylsulfatase A-like enzyme
MSRHELDDPPFSTKSPPPSSPKPTTEATLRTHHGLTCAWLAGLLLAAGNSPATAAERRPNVVLIVTDNHGAWTLGCYGNCEIKTPNIDRLASEGMRFTRAYCAHTLCSPSRATILTGLLPSQHGVHFCPVEPDVKPAELYRPSLIQEFQTLPQILSQSGYVCGLSGKWHLGDYLRPQAGFSDWYTLPGGHTLTFDNAEVVWQGKVRHEPRYLTDAITDHAIAFIQQNRSQPFFLLLAYNGPYGVSSCFTKTHQNRHTEFYADKPLKSFPREQVHPWQKYRLELINNDVAIRGYAAAVSGVDDGVGRILKVLSDLGLDKETLVLFTADQGFNGGHGGMWGMGEHTVPVNTREPTVRIPFIARQRARIPAHTVSQRMISTYDLLPTLLHYLNLGDKVPTEPRLPGRNFAPFLEGKTIEWNDVIFHDFDTTRMIRTPRWKYTRRYPNGPAELYDMEHDPEERHNLIDRAETADVQRKLRGELEKFFEQYADPKYDRTHNGKSKVEHDLTFR